MSRRQTAPAVADGTWRHVTSLMRVTLATRNAVLDDLADVTEDEVIRFAYSDDTRRCLARAAELLDEAAQVLAKAVGQKAVL